MMEIYIFLKLIQFGRFQILIGTISGLLQQLAQLVSSYHISVLKLAGGKLPVSGQSMQKAQFEIRLLMCSALILITGNIIVPSLCIYDDCLLSGLWMHSFSCQIVFSKLENPRLCIPKCMSGLNKIIFPLR